MIPTVVVLSGTPYLARAKALMRSMINVPINLNEFGRVMVELMTLSENASPARQADIVQPFIRQFTINDLEQCGGDPGFDERIMYEALFFTANNFRIAWQQQVPLYSWEGFRFMEWLGDDLALTRRGV